MIAGRCWDWLPWLAPLCMLAARVVRPFAYCRSCSFGPSSLRLSSSVDLRYLYCILAVAAAADNVDCSDIGLRLGELVFAYDGFQQDPLPASGQSLGKHYRLCFNTRYRTLIRMVITLENSSSTAQRAAFFLKIGPPLGSPLIWTWPR